MGRAAKLFILFLLFYFAGWEEAGELEAVLVQPNRSIILGEVQELERDFPQVKLTVRVIKSYAVEGYANLIKEDEVIEIQPSYTGEEFKIASFFENERNLNNLQGYYFIAGDYFFAEVSLFGDEKIRKVLYLNIQRLNVESALKMVEKPDEFLRSYPRALDITLEELPPKPPKEYAKLASVLYELVQSPNRNDFARSHGLYLHENKVRVIIELLPDYQAVEGEYGMVVEGKARNLIKALVPVDELVCLARDPSVGFLRLPHKPRPLSTTGG